MDYVLTTGIRAFCKSDFDANGGQIAKWGRQQLKPQTSRIRPLLKKAPCLTLNFTISTKINFRKI